MRDVVEQTRLSAASYYYWVNDGLSAA